MGGGGGGGGGFTGILVNHGKSAPVNEVSYTNREKNKFKMMRLRDHGGASF